MDPIDLLLIERACERLCVDYARRADERSDAYADLFTRDGHVLLLDVECRGRDELLAFIRRRRAEGLLTRHMCSNIEIDVVSPTEAIGTVDSAYYVGRPFEGIADKRILAPSSIGTYTDRYRLTAAGWRIADRTYRQVFRRAEPSQKASAIK